MLNKISLLITIGLLSMLLMIPQVQANDFTLNLSAKLLKDNSGLVYIGYSVPNSKLSIYLTQLEQVLGAVKFKRYRAAQAQRDHHNFHITLINPFEYPDIKSIDLTKFARLNFSLIGLGQAEKGSNTSYFVVVKSEQAQNIRGQYQLKQKDFHITLGFDQSDVFGVNKGVNSLIELAD